MSYSFRLARGLEFELILGNLLVHLDAGIFGYPIVAAGLEQLLLYR